jgi:hypothetical protein
MGVYSVETVALKWDPKMLHTPIVIGVYHHTVSISQAHDTACRCSMFDVDVRRRCSMFDVDVDIDVDVGL